MNNEDLKKIKSFLLNVWIFVAWVLIFTWLMWLTAYGINSGKQPHFVDWPSDPNVNTDTQLDPNLTNTKPTKRWRLNDNWYSQRYIYLESEWREDRMKEFLSHYDKAPEYEVRKVVARIYQIYPEVLICIAYADTSLWNFLKTPNNYGNVGNTESGRTKSMHTAEQWVNAIWQTLTNRYLWDKITIWDLSYAWNCSTKCEKVYATSNSNRENNVLNCMGMIRNKNVNPNFAFRW